MRELNKKGWEEFLSIMNTTPLAISTSNGTKQGFSYHAFPSLHVSMKNASEKLSLLGE